MADDGEKLGGAYVLLALLGMMMVGALNSMESCARNRLASGTPAKPRAVASNPSKPQPALPIPSGPQPASLRPSKPKPEVPTPLPVVAPDLVSIESVPEPRLNSRDGLGYVRIPGGSFDMGCSPEDPDCGSVERPRHRVTISRDFYLGQTEVTVRAYRRFVKVTGREMPPDRAPDDFPVERVRWDEAETYCKWAGGRLPTEAQWEYAARAGSRGPHYGELNAIAWFEGNSGGVLHPVKQRHPNAYGLYDMLGNVWEWCSDRFEVDYYTRSAARDPAGPEGKTAARSRRGGSWDSKATLVQSFTRMSLEPDYRFNGVGFRCACDVLPGVNVTFR